MNPTSQPIYVRIRASQSQSSLQRFRFRDRRKVPLHPADLGALQHVFCGEVVTFVDQSAPERVRTLDARTGGGELGGDVDGDEPARGRRRRQEA